MGIHVFSGAKDHYGFTGDKLGANLPPEFGPWVYLKQIDLKRDQPRIAVDVIEAADDIEAKGWHVNQAKITFDVK